MEESKYVQTEAHLITRLEFVMDKDQVLLVEMQEAWKDIRSFSSTVWQVTGLSLTAVGLVVGQAIGGSFNGAPILTSFLGWLLLLFAVLVSIIALSAMNWLFGAVITRADMIHQMEREFHDFSIELYSQQFKGVFPKSRGPYGFGILMIFEWKELPLLLGTLFLVIANIANLGMQYVGYQISPNVLLDNLNTIFTFLIVVALAYQYYGNLQIRNRYVDFLKQREIRIIREKYKNFEDGKESS